MKKFIPIVLLAVLGCSMVGCNTNEEKADKQAANESVYKFVQVREDGSELVEDMKAENDTVALTLFLDRVEKSVMANIDKQEKPFKAMYIVSSKGDTLNTNEDLLMAVAQKSSFQPKAASAPLK